MPRPSRPDKLRSAFAVDERRSVRAGAAAADHDDVIDGWVEPLTRLEDEHRAVKTGRQLPAVVKVRVVHERAGARRRESHDEAFSGLDERRQTLARAAPAVDAVVVAFQLHAVPVDRGCFRQPVDESNLHWLSAMEDERRSGKGYAGASI
jgi:anti-sigma-K factor RskA